MNVKGKWCLWYWFINQLLLHSKIAKSIYTMLSKPYFTPQIGLKTVKSREAHGCHFKLTFNVSCAFWLSSWLQRKMRDSTPMTVSCSSWMTSKANRLKTKDIYCSIILWRTQYTECLIRRTPTFLRTGNGDTGQHYDPMCRNSQVTMVTALLGELYQVSLARCQGQLT